MFFIKKKRKNYSAFPFLPEEMTADSSPWHFSHINILIFWNDSGILLKIETLVMIRFTETSPVGVITSSNTISLVSLLCHREGIETLKQITPLNFSRFLLPVPHDPPVISRHCLQLNRLFYYLELYPGFWPRICFCSHLFIKNNDLSTHKNEICPL